jgi:hypothetical protein
METYSEEASKAMAAEFAAQSIAENGVIEAVAPIVETPIVVAPEVVAPIVEEVKPIVEAVAPIVETPEVTVKSFEEELVERSNGKYKSWAEMEADLTPKELKFANDKIKRFNELAEKGVDVTSREFLELQSLDVDKLDKVDDILFEKWKRGEEGKGLSDKTIKFEINKKYNVNEWIEKEESDFTDEDFANREKMQRDAGLGKEWLTNYKNERVLDKQIDPAQVAAMAKTRENELSNWDKMVDSDIINKVAKLSSPISYKDETGKVVESKIDLDVSAEDMKYVSDLFKQLPRDSNAFFSQFKDDKGNQNHEALAQLIVKARNYDKAVAAAYTSGAEQRALVIEKNAKNTNFTATPTVDVPKVFASMEEALADAVRQQEKTKK